MQQRSTIIFDFDGTLADTFLLAIDVFCKIRPLPFVLNKKQIQRLRGMAMLEVARELHIRTWEIPLLAFRGRKVMAAHMTSVQLVEGVTEVVKKLHDAGHQLFVVSSNSERNVRTVLAAHGVEHCFDDVYGSVRFHGKARTLRRIRRGTGAGLGHIFYVGDEVRDVHAARKSGMSSIAVSWGYNTLALLKKQHPYAIAFEPSEIVTIIEKDT